jgi:hypothetical protein
VVSGGICQKQRFDVKTEMLQTTTAKTNLDRFLLLSMAPMQMAGGETPRWVSINSLVKELHTQRVEKQQLGLIVRPTSTYFIAETLQS